MDRFGSRLISAIVALGVVLATLTGCSRVAGGVVRADVAQSDKARLAPSADRVPELVAGNTGFALDLYRVAGDTGSNLFLSPYSISLALAMTFAGARGQTAQEMADTLHFALPQEQLHPAFNALDQALASRGKQTTDDGEPFRLHVANALWGQKDFSFQPAFLDLLAEHYGAGMRLLDYRNAPEPARETINRWVEEQTEEKIKDLLPPGSINNLTRLVLSNAIYFNAGWMFPFLKEATHDGSFHLLDGSTVTVPMMQQSGHLGFGEGEGYQAVELPYVGGQMSMLILLPAEGRFKAFAEELDAAALAAIVEGIRPEQVALTLPRFRYESSLRLKEALIKLGMVQAFDVQAADFTGMTGKPDLFIDDV
ncbi:MAG: serpin family protein, partial [Anaerolineae bacterium]|nr:serpin family protein [Anaerolineae bacterium]